jgi:hypothetical protein
MVGASRNGLGRAATAAVIIVVVIVAFSASYELNSKAISSTTTSLTKSTSLTTSSAALNTATSQTSSSSTTVSSSSTSTGCTFAAPPPVVEANNTVLPTFTGCLAPGATGTYLLAITDPNGMVAQGEVRTQQPAEISVAGAPVMNFTAGNGGNSVNDSTILAFSDGLSLRADSGYGFTVVNQSQENNTVTIIIILTDQVQFDQLFDAGGA